MNAQFQFQRTQIPFFTPTVSVLSQCLGTGLVTVPPIVDDVLNSPGQPLDSGTRAFMEPRFGHDFSRVRVHPDVKAAESARAVNALAYTVGNDMVFGNGQYKPATASGQRLLGHELAHVVQQEQASSRTLVQREIKVVDPTAATPHTPVPLAQMTNADIVKSWVVKLCPTGSWTVDGATGLVSSPNRNTFCGKKPTPKLAHYSTSKTPTSCSCLCELTAPGSTDIRVHAADYFILDGITTNLSIWGEGVTIGPYGLHPETNVGVSGKEYTSIIGAGDTAPQAGTNPKQNIRDPAWLIFAHEVCGHARLQSEKMQTMHTQTPEGNLSTVDVENKTRREHSTKANNLGLRRGEFEDANGHKHDGSFYKVASGETLLSIAVRCGLTQTEILTRMFRENGDAITKATQNTIGTGERLLIENIFWHEVITDETMSSIAKIWDITLASLIRANPSIIDPGVIRPGQRLLIPVK